MVAVRALGQWVNVELQLLKWSTIMCDRPAIHLVLDAEKVAVRL